jgi:hypothetical protein
MVEQISSFEELEQEIWKCKGKDGSPKWTYARLNPEAIEQWKQERFFHFIRRELVDIHNLKFACLQDDKGMCEYWFIAPSKELKNRIYHMLMAYFKEKRTVPLMRCKNTIPESYEKIKFIKGNVKACPLFRE